MDILSSKMNKSLNHPRLWICIGLTILTLAVYGQVHRFEFIDLDDGDYVFENWHVASGLVWANVIWALTSGHAANWHPLTWLSHMADCQFFGLNPGYAHLNNVLLHIANTVLLFLLLQRLTGARWRSAVVAALFALHPLHIESVAWIAERKDVLSTFFLLITLWTYASYTRKPGFARYLLSLCLFAFGLMAKPMLVTLPFVLLLLDFWPLGRFTGAAQKAGRSRKPQRASLLRSAIPLLREKIPFFVLTAGSSAVTFLVQRAGGAVKANELLSLDTRVANAIHSYFLYLVKTFWPARLNIFYRFPSSGYYPAWQVILQATFLLCVTVLVLRFVSRRPYLAFGWFWYLGTLVPVIGLVQVGSQAMADRYTYVPLIGAFVIIAWGVTDLLSNRPGRQLALSGLATAAILLCAVATYRQLHYWRDSIALFSRALEIDPDSYFLHELLGTGLAKRNQYEQAVVQYTEALRLLPNNIHVMGNLGYSLTQLGKVDQALEYYDRALKVKPEDPAILRYMGQTRYEQGRFQEAADCFLRARKRGSEDVLAELSLGNALAKLGRTDEAIDAYNRVLRLRPSYPEALFGLGIAFSAQGKAPDAVRAFEQALGLNPDYAEAHNNLGNVVLQLGQTEKALWHYEEALRLNPKYAEAHYNKGVVLNSQGKVTEAISQYREAIRLKPDYVDALYNLAAALDAQGDVNGAVSSYNQAIRLKPDFVEAYNNLGVCLFNHGQIEKALEVFSGALRVDPNNADARRNRDAILASLGKAKRYP